MAEASGYADRDRETTLPRQDEPLIQERPFHPPTRSDNSDNPGMFSAFGTRLRKSVRNVTRVFNRCDCDKSTCSVCGTKNYQKLLNEEHCPVEVLTGSLDLVFYMEDPPDKSSYSIKVTKGMTASEVCRRLAQETKMNHYWDYSIFEYWTEYDAFRRLEDHESVLDEFQYQLKSSQGHNFRFICRTDYDKFDWISHKNTMFQHPEEVRYFKDSPNPIIDVTQPSPEKILIGCSFFHKEIIGDKVETSPTIPMVPRLPKPTQHGGDQSKTGAIKRPSKFLPVSPEERKMLQETLAANKVQSFIRETSFIIDPSVQQSDNEDGIKVAAKETTSTGSTPKKTLKPPQSPVTGMSEPSSPERAYLTESKTAKKSISAGNLETSSNIATSQDATKDELIDKSEIAKKSISAGNIEAVASTSRAVISPIGSDDLPSALTTSGYSSPVDEYPNPLRGKITRWRVHDVVLREKINPETDDLEDSAYSPVYCGQVLVRKDADNLTIPLAIQFKHKPETTKWEKRYLLVRNQNLYFVRNKQNMYKFYMMTDMDFQEEHRNLRTVPRRRDALQLIGHVSHFRAYYSTGCRRYFSPKRRGVVLLREMNPSSCPLKLMFVANYLLTDMLAMGRIQWLTALKFAQHGRQIYLNLCRQTFLKETNCRTPRRVINEDLVAMDFSRGYGRVLTDPEDIERVQQAHLHGNVVHKLHIISNPEIFRTGTHLTQKYYHKKMNRAEAEKLLRMTPNGTWLLRDSESRSEIMVISYHHQKSIGHAKVKVANYQDEYTKIGIHIVTLDEEHGFYDVNSLIEYHRLNKGRPLPCKLGCSLKHQSQPDDTPPRLPSGIKPLYGITKKPQLSLQRLFKGSPSPKKGAKKE